MNFAKGFAMGYIDDLGRCIERINSADNPADAFSTFCSILENYGYNRIAYSLVTDHPSLNLPCQHGLATSYPDDWMKHYRDNQYFDIDPVVHGVMSSRRPFFWSDLVDDPNIPKESYTLMKQAEESGIYSGIGFSLTGLSGEVVGIGLARDTKCNDGKDHDFLASAHLLSTYFHETYRDLILEHQPLPSVTCRETDILHWGAEGKSDEEIAMILGITARTVRFHWSNIFEKLQANGRVYAITKAIRFGLITPNLIHLPCQD
jgi:DNA-binding CsgD family transcriptional regulator